MIFNTGGRYNPSTNTWATTITTGAPSARGDHTAVWEDLGNLMIIWGGATPAGFFDTGGRYCAAAPNPTATPTATARPTPTPRIAPTPRARPTPPPRP
jgi:hypothetical protein